MYSLDGGISNVQAVLKGEGKVVPVVN